MAKNPESGSGIHKHLLKQNPTKTSHVHSHHEVDIDPLRARKAKKLLVVITIPILLLTIAGMAFFYPYEKTLAWSKPLFSSAVKQGKVIVTSLDVKSCELPGLEDSSLGQLESKNPGKTVSPSEVGEAIDSSGETGKNQAATGMESQSTTEIEKTPNDKDTKEVKPRANASLLSSAVCARVLSGEGKDSIVPVHIPPESKEAVGIGTVIKVIYDPGIVTAGTPFIFWDIAREKALLALGIIYVVIVVAVAGLRGIRALLGLVGSTIVFMGFVLPALMSGEPPMLVTLVGSSAMMFMSVYFAHGISVRTTTALLGTFTGLALTVGLANWGTWASGITGANAEDAQMIVGYFPGLSLQALFTCGVVIAGLGALNDVTITQASAVWELNEANPALPKWKLFAHAMQIGRDHIASTVYTLAFAYAGTAMPTLILAIIIDRSTIELLSVATIAEEVVRTLVASIGLVIAIPATTLVGTLLVKAVSGGNAAEDIHLAENPDSRISVETNIAAESDNKTDTNNKIGTDSLRNNSGSEEISVNPAKTVRGFAEEYWGEKK